MNCHNVGKRKTEDKQIRHSILHLVFQRAATENVTTLSLSWKTEIAEWNNNIILIRLHSIYLVLVPRYAYCCCKKCTPKRLTNEFFVEFKTFIDIDDYRILQKSLGLTYQFETGHIEIIKFVSQSWASVWVHVVSCPGGRRYGIPHPWCWGTKPPPLRGGGFLSAE